MELGFAAPELDTLDRAGSEVLALAWFEDERPPRGVAGLVDWRLGARLSRVLASGFASGALGEVLLVPGKPGVPFDKILLFGAGPVSSFDESVFDALAHQLLRAAEGLRTRTLVTELPGRHRGLIAPERAATLLLDAAEGRPEHEVWTLLEPPAAQKAITQKLIEQRRRTNLA